MTPYPLILQPVYKDYVWGGARIPRVYHRNLPDGVYAESWEIADRPEGMSIVAKGPLRGRSLRQLVVGMCASLLGSAVNSAVFPLLVKLIDARERLSVQVHPDDETAARWGGEAKTEAWHVLDAAPDARVFAGLQAAVTELDFKRALSAGRLADCLQSIPVSAGDTIFIPGGRVHAIGEGLLLLEVQQNSNTTYRVYDWGRVGKDGRPRELHVAEALRVIRWADTEAAKTTPREIAKDDGHVVSEVASCRYFQAERITLTAPLPCRNDGTSFHILFVTTGNVKVEGRDFAEPIGAGTTCLLPAAIAEYALAPSAPHAELLRIRVP
jgi:mannose-6-phosphate isomerase